MSLFKPCIGKNACSDDTIYCRGCGRSIEEVNCTRTLINALSELIEAADYENIEEFLQYFSDKVAKKVCYRRNKTD